VKAFSSALIGLCVPFLLSLPAPALGAGQNTTEDVPVRGGVAALATAASVAPAPDRARAVAELARAVYSWPQTGPYSNDAVRRRIAAFFADASPGATTETVPVPLPVTVWSQAILHRPVSPENLVGAILTDRTAALMCYALAGMDDETVQFFADHAPLLGRLATRAPATFAAFGESLRIHNGRLVPRGGDAAIAPWEAVVGETLDRPERFVLALFESDRGRLAYLYDLLAHLDAPQLALALGAGRAGQDAALKRLASLARRAFPEWDVTTAPFVRPQTELSAFFARLRNASAAGAEATSWGSPAFWQRVFGEAGPLDAVAANNTPGEARADAITLAEMILLHPARERDRRLDLLTFAERTFAAQSIDVADVTLAIRGFGSFPVLMLTLERMGVRTPAVYAATARQAERLTALDAARGHTALAQFQGSLALLSRLAAVRTIDTATGERLVRDLVAVKLNDDGRYDGAMAAWISSGLRPVLMPGAIDDALLNAAAGPPSTGPGRRVEWEGQRYNVDPAGAELQRLRRARARQEETRFETVLGLAALAQTLLHQPFTLDDAREAAAKLTAAAAELAAGERAADAAVLRALKDAAQTVGGIKRPADVSEAKRAGAHLVPVADDLLGGALLSLAYAFDLGDPEGTILIAGDPSRRHDFGYALPGRDARVRSMWSIATVETRGGPWHLVGSALALDLAMSQLALRRISVDRVPESPMLNLMQRDGFAASVAVMNPLTLTDADRDAITARVEQGAARVQEVVSGRESVEALIDAIEMDGWRTRALKWTIAHEPDRAASLFSMVELLVLGGGSPAAFNSWGVYSLHTAGCLCARLPAPSEWRHWWGLAQSGLPATLVADLPLRAAVVLHNLQLPAVLAKSVLAAAMQDFVDGINPTDGNDWLTLARAAQEIGQQRFEDYIAAATADGPLLPDASGTPGQQ